MANVTAQEIAREFGLSARHWTRQAALGKVPGACQPSGAKGRWLFDPEKFRRWWASRQREVKAWPGYTGEARDSGGVPSVRGRNTGVPLAREIDELLKSACASG